ncbi:multiple myeloma tumor-associated protein 2, partial [Tanacetum coccineum]
MEASKEEIWRIKEEEQAMRETLGLAPKCAAKSQGSKLDKHEFSELIKREVVVMRVDKEHDNRVKQMKSSEGPENTYQPLQS